MNKFSSSRRSSTISRNPGTKSILRADYFAENLIVIPPDGGWGWMVVVSSFMCALVIDGIIYTFGLFLVDISESFNVHSTEVATACSVLSGFYYLLGPVTCALTNRFGFRLIGVFGSLISAMAFILSSMVNVLPTFITIYGFVGGLGFNMIFTPSILAIGFYFERWRALATSIAVCGTSIGVVIFPPLVTNAFHNFHWRTKFKLLGGLCGMCGLFAMAYKPLKPVRILEDEKRVQFEDDGDSIGSFYIDNEPLSIKQIFKRFHNSLFPTGSEVRSSVVTINTSGKVMNYDSSTMIANLPPEASISSVGTRSALKSISSKYDSISEKLTTVYEEDDEPTIGKKRSVCQKCCQVCEKKYLFCCNLMCPNGIVNRPMYRDDIFYTGSVYTLPQYSRSTVTAGPSAKKSTVDYNLSVTRVATQKDLDENSRCICCPISVVRTLATMLDFSLMKSPSFVLMTLSGFFTLLGIYSPFLFVVQRAEEMQIDKKRCYFLLSIMGIANTFGRITCGIISSFPKIDALVVSYVTIFICGATTIISNYLPTLEGQIIYAIVFGFTIASVPALRSVVLVELVGLENLTNAFGITLLFQGIASFLGLPIGSLLEYYSGSYNLTFLFAGCFILFSAILMMPIKCILKWEQTKQEKKFNIYIR